ncbi:MAG: DUF4388 domain-containing protein [Planctomycetota bacterium]
MSPEVPPDPVGVTVPCPAFAPGGGAASTDGSPTAGVPAATGPVDGGPVDGGPVDGGAVDGGPVAAGADAAATGSATNATMASGVDLGATLRERIHTLVDGLVRNDDTAFEEAFIDLSVSVRGLVERKLRMEGSKSETRDVLGELIFTRLRQGMLQFASRDDAREAEKAALWAMATMFSVRTLTEFARAFDESLLRATAASRDFNLASRTDFISIEEMLQMLATGKHIGCLSLEKGDNRLDIYLKEGRIVLLDPHRLNRRVMPGANVMRHREIPEAVVHEAESRRVSEGVPALLTLAERGVFKDDEVRDQLRAFGKESLFEFMREEEPYAFHYKRLDVLPPRIEANDIRLGVTSTLLEGSKLNDDWKQLQKVYPDPDAPIEPRADMYARMANVTLGVLEIKLLTQLQGDTTPRNLVGQLGLPLFDIYLMLARLIKEGILTPGSGARAVEHVPDEPAPVGVTQSVAQAIQALDANDDKKARTSAIDRVLGDAPPKSTMNALDRVLGGLDETLRRKNQPRPGGGDDDLLGLMKKPNS